MTLKDKRRRTKLKLREDEVNEQSGTHLTESACLQRHRGWKKEDLQIVKQWKTRGRFDEDDHQHQQHPRYPDHLSLASLSPRDPRIAKENTNDTALPIIQTYTGDQITKQSDLFRGHSTILSHASVTEDSSRISATSLLRI